MKDMRLRAASVTKVSVDWHQHTAHIVIESISALNRSPEAVLAPRLHPLGSESSRVFQTSMCLQVPDY